MENILKAVEKYIDVIDNAEKFIWKNPEVGFKEFKTNEFMINEFTKLGYSLVKQDDITGFWTYFDTGKEGPTVLLLAELDSLICREHPDADKETGAVHNCGHHLQCASILGVAGAIKDKSVSQDLCGKVKFCVVPAEEGVEITYRKALVQEGVITYTSGKPEYIKRGLLDDVDLAFMLHGCNGGKYNDTIYHFVQGSNGVIRKEIEITGKSAHAGGNPWDGINALNASQLALSACNALRETFKDEEHVRFHSIITKGGDAVSAVPEKVVLESYVRAGNGNALRRANDKINRAITGACLAVGAKVKITDLTGSEPLLNNPDLTNLMHEEGVKFVGEAKCEKFNVWLSSSTDMGDVSTLVPAVHAYVDAEEGLAHGKDYRLKNPLKTCINSACLQIATLVRLLKDGGEKAYEIKQNFNPVYQSVEEYLSKQDSINQTIDCITYTKNGIKINL